MREFEGIMQQVTSGGLDSQSVGQAADQHVNAMDPDELTQHVQTAANNAQQSGDTQLGQQLMGLVEQYRSNPQGLKGEVVSLITNNPQILEQFAPDFAKGLLSRI